ncbi:amino acid ABC transporter substrate-binding protein (PAAT family) [Corticibacter populi]|nr:transporter substrate-binding domain-containing protein [Corticibacter populi]RZS32001.1 amino acid ABC transporter substrate-binding protein (PAAT family) [Corticibacter populi]
MHIRLNIPLDRLRWQWSKAAARWACATVLVATHAIGGGVAPLAAGTRDSPVPQTPQTPRSLQTLKIGLPAQAMPLQSSQRDYTEEGLEAALALALAERLGMRAELLPLPAGGEQAALQQGQVDVALLQASAARPPAFDGEAVTALLPTGFETPLSVAMRSDTDVRDWRDLEGRTVCLTHASARAHAWLEGLGARLHWLDAPAQVLAQVRTGQCDAALGNQAQLQALFERQEWRKFSATLPPQQPQALWLAVGRAEDGADDDAGDGAEAWAARLQPVLAELGSPAQWDARVRQWAADVAFEVYFDQIGPDCH